jgi:acyl-CoA reductase-like NAD-dependent aldehyde dehydrogenase
MATTPVERRHFGLHIGGQEVAPADGATFESVDPTTGAVWATFGEATREDVNRAVDAAQAAFEGPWRSFTATKRGRLMMRLADAVNDHAEEIAALEVRDNGKLYKEMLTQLRVTPDWLYYFGGLADKIEGRVIPVRPDVLNYTAREPLGVVGIITPWNSPVLVTMYALAPALAAGNTVVCKPSEFAPASLLAVAALAEEAGIPPGVINVVTGGGDAGRFLVENEKVRAVAFTGSSETGARVAGAAAGRLARATLELGGKSANIVFEDANLEAAESGVLAGIYAAAGQTCVAGSRVLLHESIYDEMLERLAARAEAIQLGDPMAEATQMGPIANAPQLERVTRMVEEATAAGAQVVAGGARASLPDFPGGFFYRPTLLNGVAATDSIAQNEVFGPVLVAMRFSDEAEAIRLANQTRYGLAAGLWTENVKRAHRVAARLEAGTVWINLYRAVTFNSPFGGYKASGLGRVNGSEAVEEFLQTKSVWCELSDAVQDPFVLKV